METFFVVLAWIALLVWILFELPGFIRRAISWMDSTNPNQPSLDDKEPPHGLGVHPLDLAEEYVFLFIIVLLWIVILMYIFF